MDPYLFQNFLTEDGDQLEATFKAFKFPESNFVLFKGTVNVCLDRCTGVSADPGNILFIASSINEFSIEVCFEIEISFQSDCKMPKAARKFCGKQ